MKACVLTDWKKIELKDVPVPEPEEDEVLVEVLYGGVCGSDVTVFNHHHLTATIPRILCHEILGRVSRINSDKKLPYAVGDKVVVFPLIYCSKCKACLTGHTSACSSLQIRGLHVDGGFAEYIKVDTGSVIPVDQTLPDRIAVLTEPFSIGYHSNRIAETQTGDTVLVIGGGPIGLITAITAQYFGAKVLISEPNASRRAIAEEFGFETLDPLTQDIPEEVKKRTGGMGSDVVMEVSGTQAGFDTAVSRGERMRGHRSGGDPLRKEGDPDEYVHTQGGKHPRHPLLSVGSVPKDSGHAGRYVSQKAISSGKTDREGTPAFRRGRRTGAPGIWQTGWQDHHQYQGGFIKRWAICLI